jgi:hypothetical protein
MKNPFCILRLHPMHRPVLVLGFAALFLAGCVAPSAPSKAEAANTPAVATPLIFDDPKPVFEELYSRAQMVSKDRLETEAEYRARLAAIGYEGKEFTFLIPPGLCQLRPFPEKNLYVLTAQDAFMKYDNPKTKLYGISVAQFTRESPEYTIENEFGTRARASNATGSYLKIAPLDFTSLPRALRWGDKLDIYIKFGLSITPTDPGFRDKLRAEKIGLAVRVKVAQLERMTIDYWYEAATFSNPVGVKYSNLLVPVFILDAWIVDTDTNLALEHWHNPKKV